MSERNDSHAEQNPLERLSDRELIRRFADSRDDEAFRILVSRHAKLVFGVCRRILRHQQDAEDAFQATFLVLASKAGRVRWQESLANWLYTTAYRIALKAQTAAQKSREVPMTSEPILAALALDQVARSAACRALDEELNQLPEKYRKPLILCYLEDKTREQAAQELGLTPAAIKGRLHRGRHELRLRLVRRGIALSAAGGGLTISSGASGAPWIELSVFRIPEHLVTATVDGAAQFATRGSAAGTITTQAMRLAEGELMPLSVTSIAKPAAAAAIASMLVAIPCLLLSSAVVADDAQLSAVALRQSAEGPSDDQQLSPAAEHIAFQARPSESGATPAGAPVPNAFDRSFAPTAEAEKSVGRLVLVFYNDRLRRAVPAVLIDAGSETLVVTAAPATVVPNGTPRAVDRAYLEFPGRLPVEARYTPASTKELTVYLAEGGLTSYRPNDDIELAIGDVLSTILPDSSKELQVTHDAAQVVALDREADLELPDVNLQHHYEDLVEIDRLLPEGTPLFKDGKLAGLTLLGMRFLGENATKSYVLPVERIKTFGREVGAYLSTGDRTSDQNTRKVAENSPRANGEHAVPPLPATLEADAEIKTEILLSGLRGAEVLSLDGEPMLELPGRLTFRGQHVKFKLTQVLDNSEATLYGMIYREETSERTQRFLEEHAIALEVGADDVQAASHGVLTKYVFLPHLQPGEKWAGHFGTLTMGAVSKESDSEVRQNLKKLGALLVVFELGNRLPDLPSRKYE